MRGRDLILAAVLTAVPLGPAAPQQQRAPPHQKAPRHALPVRAAQALYLIRSTLLTLNDANRSGNYTVLRDLAAPDFQTRNSPADLAGIFANLRHRHFDLFAVALMAPKLSTPPYLDPSKMLRLSGFFPTRPLQINFDLTFQNVGGHWRLFGISVATPPAPPQPKAERTPARPGAATHVPKSAKAARHFRLPRARPTAAPAASAPGIKREPQ